MSRRGFCGVSLQWVDCGWCWTQEGFPVICFSYDHWGINECNNKKPVGYASREVICWHWDGTWPSCCSSLCNRGFTSNYKGYFWELNSDCNMSWNYGCSIYWIPFQGDSGWRICFWVSAIPAVILAFAMEFCAESPHWLFKRGRRTEAVAEFEKLLGGIHVKPAIAELSCDRGDESDTIKFSKSLYSRHFKVMFIGCTLFALQQLSGINAVFYFSPTIFKSFGVPSDLANTCVGICNLVGSILAMILMDKLGRKVLLMGSFMAMAVSLGLQIIAASSFASEYGAMYLSVGSMLMFVLSFALGAGPVPGLLLSEILPSAIRAKAMAICMAVHWVMNFFVGLLFLRLLEQIGAQLLYAIFAAFCLMAVIFVKKNVVETKGKSLQEIEMAHLPQQAT
ncbi:probable plastidic glucose transporter 3 isoform X3 [Prosopis cineraria]|uniref:probable plastidic glucose transporter 3 isoform X3 n=1 Tax=Prosopis cineraria TaxID=364024 RepID=UPI00240F4C8A|nr:probable plastidic glucose transporter 3 isoform X3 [Prosopis cineraria]XP_054785414.1 probable plastidic glucose transporter 3 isoform X3 [Prosopis cineraria]